MATIVLIIGNLIGVFQIDNFFSCFLDFGMAYS